MKVCPQKVSCTGKVLVDEPKEYGCELEDGPYEEFVFILCLLIRIEVLLVLRKSSSQLSPLILDNCFGVCRFWFCYIVLLLSPLCSYNL